MYSTHSCNCVAAGLLDEASEPSSDVEVLSSPRARIILRRLAVAAGITLLVGALVAVRFFVHFVPKTDWAPLCIPNATASTELPTFDHSAAYHNVTLAPCTETVTVHLPPTTWSAYIPI